MIKETDGEGTTVYKYPKCPACGSKKRHFEAISEKAIKMGTAPEGSPMPYNFDERTVVHPSKEARLELGSEAPKIQVATDICEDCGCVYATMVVTGKATKTLQTPKLIIPGKN